MSGRGLGVHWLVCAAVCILAAGGAGTGRAGVQAQEPPGRAPEILRTPGGVRFGLAGKKPAAPAPTLFVFASSIEETLGKPAYDRVGALLAEHGFLSVSLDLPCHGQERRGDEPAGLAGWPARLKRDQDVVRDLTARASAVLDYLIAEGYTDERHVAACGTSRGGFMALHFAAAEPRVKCVAAFAPVTELTALREFAGLEQHEATRSLAIARHAPQLAGKHVWMCIGNRDERVGTEHAVAAFQKIVQAWAAVASDDQAPIPVELRVVATAGHRTHATAHDDAAAWILQWAKERQRQGGE